MREVGLEVYLGGIHGDGRWKTKLKALLNIDHYDPIVHKPFEKPFERKGSAWARCRCTHILHVVCQQDTITLSTAQVADDTEELHRVLWQSLQMGRTLRGKIVFCMLDANSYPSETYRMIDVVAETLELYGVKTCTSLEEVARYLNE